MSEQPEKYDLFSSREAAELYATYQPPLSRQVVDMILKHAPDRDTLVDIGRCSILLPFYLRPLVHCTATLQFALFDPLRGKRVWTRRPSISILHFQAVDLVHRCYHLPSTFPVFMVWTTAQHSVRWPGRGVHCTLTLPFTRYHYLADSRPEHRLYHPLLPVSNHHRQS